MCDSDTSFSYNNSIPIGKLPVELLATIFKAAQYSGADYDRWCIPIPVVISGVCRHWRNVAVADAALWSDIRVFEFDMSTNDLALMFLERSGDSLIDVSYHCHDTLGSAFDFLLGHLLPHFGRVRRFTLMLEDDFQLRTCKIFLEDLCAPCLESLSIFVSDPIAYPSETEKMTDQALGSFPLFTSGAPLLRSVDFDGFLFLTQPQFSQLTSFSLQMSMAFEYVSLQKFLSFLADISKTLTRLTVRGIIFDLDVSDLRSSSVVLPLVKSLDLFESAILPALNTPLLEHLYLKDDTLFNRDEDPDGIVMVDTFIEWCLMSESSTLSFLKLETFDLSHFKNNTAAFRILRHLTDLVLSNCANEYSFLNLLMEESRGQKDGNSNAQVKRRPQTDIMPLLRSLTITDDESWPLLQSIILDRDEKGGIPIQCVCIPGQSADMSRKTWLSCRNIEYKWLLDELDLAESELAAEKDMFQQDAEDQYRERGKEEEDDAAAYCYQSWRGSWR